MIRKFNCYADPGHAWLKVPMKLLAVLGIGDEITPFSYMRGDYAYLEEDCDVTRFHIAYVRKYETNPEIKVRHTNRQSKIRNYNHFDWSTSTKGG